MPYLDFWPVVVSHAGTLSPTSVSQFLSQHGSRPSLVLALDGGRKEIRTYEWTRGNGAGHRNAFTKATENFDNYVREFEANVNLGARLPQGEGTSCNHEAPPNTCYIENDPFKRKLVVDERGVSKLSDSVLEPVPSEAELIRRFVAHKSAGKRLRFRKTMRDEEAVKGVLGDAMKGLVEGEEGRISVLNTAVVNASVLEPFNEVFLDVGDLACARHDPCFCDDFSPLALCRCLLFWTPCCAWFP